MTLEATPIEMFSRFQFQSIVLYCQQAARSSTNRGCRWKVNGWKLLGLRQRLLMVLVWKLHPTCVSLSVSCCLLAPGCVRRGDFHNLFLTAVWRLRRTGEEKNGTDSVQCCVETEANSSFKTSLPEIFQIIFPFYWFKKVCVTQTNKGKILLHCYKKEKEQNKNKLLRQNSLML